MGPELFSMAMFPSIALDQEALHELLNVFESHEQTTPRFWGHNEKIRLAYNRLELVDRVLNKQDGITQVYLHRDQTVKFSGRFDIKLSSRSFLKFEFNKSLPQRMWPTFFELSDRIAQIVKPRYGITHMFWPSPSPWTNATERLHTWMDFCSYPYPSSFIPNGPLGVGMRTYFGSDILEMFDEDFFANLPALITKPDFGGLCIDLVEKPWEADKDTILQQWDKVMNHLEEAQVFAIPNFDEECRVVTFSPNVAWTRKYRN